MGLRWCCLGGIQQISLLPSLMCTEEGESLFLVPWTSLIFYFLGILGHQTTLRISRLLPFSGCKPGSSSNSVDQFRVYALQLSQILFKSKIGVKGQLQAGPTRQRDVTKRQALGCSKNTDFWSILENAKYCHLEIIEPMGP